MGTVDYDTEHRIASGTAGRDVLDPFAIKPWTLVGLDGDDTYYVRVADYVNSLPGGVTQTLRGTDRIVEEKGGGTDTAILVTGYNGVTGIDAKDLVNVETIRVLAGNKTGWVIEGNALSNRIVGALGTDTINGGGGNDRIEGGAGQDTLKGGAGDDLFDGGSGTDRYFGGAGMDTLVFGSQKKAVSIDLTRQVSTAGETFSSIEGAVGTKFADTMTGSTVANAFDGGRGDDRLSGLGGNDTLTGGQGNDRLSGGDGNDMLSAGAGDDSLDGGAGSDVLVAGIGADRLTGGADADSFSFTFKASYYRRDVIYIGYESKIAFQAVITDFQDGVDTIRLHQANKEDAGIHGTYNDYAPAFGDLFLEQTAEGTIIHFGHPGNGEKGNTLHELNFGSVLLLGIDRSVISADDFTGVIRSYLSSTELGYI